MRLFASLRVAEVATCDMPRNKAESIKYDTRLSVNIWHDFMTLENPGCYRFRLHMGEQYRSSCRKRDP